MVNLMKQSCYEVFTFLVGGVNNEMCILGL